MFNWGLKTRGLRPIGLDIGHHSIKMIQLATNGEQIVVLAADKARVDASVGSDSEARRRSVISAIRRMLAKGGFRGRDVVSCLPNDRLKMTSLRLSETETDQIEQALRKEARQRFGLDPAKDVINYMLAGSVRQGDEIKNELILFATDDETIRTHIAMLQEAQLRPVAIDVIPCALFRTFERSLRRQEDKERTVVFVDIGSQCATIVFGRGSEICFVKQIALGEQRLNREIAARLDISINEVQMLRGRLRLEKGLPSPWPAEHTSDDNIKQLDASTREVIINAISAVAEELAREISLCFRYYTVTFRGKRIDRAIFSGGEAYESILLDVLRQQLKVEIEVAQPLRGFDMRNVKFSGFKQELLCEWAVAVGLSLKGWNGNTGEHKMPQTQSTLANGNSDERN